MWPATISDSPSTTSNGWRLVSARPEMKVHDRDRQQRQPVPRQEVQTHVMELPPPGLQHDVGHVQRASGHQHDDRQKPMAIS